MDNVLSVVFFFLRMEMNEKRSAVFTYTSLYSLAQNKIKVYYFFSLFARIKYHTKRRYAYEPGREKRSVGNI